MRYIFLAAIFILASIVVHAQPSVNEIVFFGGPGITNTGTQVYSIRADGSGQVNLTNNPAATHLSPNWSPDGTKIVRSQSGFRLPHQRATFSMLSALGGNDDCPGRIIPGGNYTAAAPYTDSGDTTGANDTVSEIWAFTDWPAFGPDLIYSFTLTGRGPNPRIEVSATSGPYQPLIYVSRESPQGGCPAGTGNSLNIEADGSWDSLTSTATIDVSQMVNYPSMSPCIYLSTHSATVSAVPVPTRSECRT